MRDEHARGDRTQQVVVVAIAAAALVADLETVRQGLEDPLRLVDGADPGAAGDSPVSPRTHIAIGLSWISRPTFNMVAS